MLLSKVSYTVFKVNTILSVHAVSGNRTHDPGVASTHSSVGGIKCA